MAQAGTFAGRARLIATALVLAAVAALVIAPARGVAASPTACPSFSVLGNDKIGPAVLPKGTYSVKVFGGLPCARASSLFTRFLQDYDGKLPNGWAVVPRSRGKAAFTHHGARRFAVERQGNGGGGGG